MEVRKVSGGSLINCFLQSRNLLTHNGGNNSKRIHYHNLYRTHYFVQVTLLSIFKTIITMKTLFVGSIATIATIVQLRHEIKRHPNALAVCKLNLLVVFNGLRGHARQGLHKLSEH